MIWEPNYGLFLPHQTGESVFISITGSSRTTLPPPPGSQSTQNIGVQECTSGVSQSWCSYAHITNWVKKSGVKFERKVQASQMTWVNGWVIRYLEMWGAVSSVIKIGFSLVKKMQLERSKNGELTNGEWDTGDAIWSGNLNPQGLTNDIRSSGLYI